MLKKKPEKQWGGVKSLTVTPGRAQQLLTQTKVGQPGNIKLPNILGSVCSKPQNKNYP